MLIDQGARAIAPVEIVVTIPGSTQRDLQTVELVRSRRLRLPDAELDRVDSVAQRRFSLARLCLQIVGRAAGEFCVGQNVQPAIQSAAIILGIFAAVIEKAVDAGMGEKIQLM